MFYCAIQGLGDDEQVKKWLPLVRELKMIGCYAQTELGHGSNVAVIFFKRIYIFSFRDWKQPLLLIKRKMNLFSIHQQLQQLSTGRESSANLLAMPSSMQNL